MNSQQRIETLHQQLQQQRRLLQPRLQHSQRPWAAGLALLALAAGVACQRSQSLSTVGLLRLGLLTLGSGAPADLSDSSDVAP